MKREKDYHLKAKQIKPLAPGRGGCIATDMITVEGHNVGFMYREKPHDEMDSGWRFMAGIESQEFMDDPNNHEVYDVNTIANYDPGIIPWLDSPAGTAFEWNPDSGSFIEAEFEPPD